MTTNTCKKTLAFVYKPPTSKLTSLCRHNNLRFSCLKHSSKSPPDISSLAMPSYASSPRQLWWCSACISCLHYYNFFCLNFFCNSMPNLASNISIKIHIWRAMNVIGLEARNCCIDTIYLWPLIIRSQGHGIVGGNKEGVLHPRLAVG